MKEHRANERKLTSPQCPADKKPQLAEQVANLKQQVDELTQRLSQLGEASGRGSPDSSSSDSGASSGSRPCALCVRQFGVVVRRSQASPCKSKDLRVHPNFVHFTQECGRVRPS